MSAPEKIYPWSWHRYTKRLSGVDQVEYTRSDTIPALIAQARRDALEEAARLAETFVDAQIDAAGIRSLIEKEGQT